jgi:hypothetical protein
MPEPKTLESLPTRDREGALPAVIAPRTLVLTVATRSHRHGECREFGDVAADVRGEIEQFFVACNASRRGRCQPLARRDAQVATRLVEAGERRDAAGR